MSGMITARRSGYGRVAMRHLSTAFRMSLILGLAVNR